MMTVISFRDASLQILRRKVVGTAIQSSRYKSVGPSRTSARLSPTPANVASRRFFANRPSASDPLATAAELDATARGIKLEQMILTTTTAKPVQQRPLFPWRHEPLDNLLPRLRPDAPEYLPNPPNLLQASIAHIFLKVPLWQTFFKMTGWRDELAMSCAYAFARGVAGILCNVYHCPSAFDEMESRVDFSFHPSERTETENESNNNTKNENEEKYCPEVVYMMEQPLRELFQSAHKHGRDQLEIRLDMQPQHATLYSVFAVPFVTRAACERDPRLAGLTQNVVSKFPSFKLLSLDVVMKYALEILMRERRTKDKDATAKTTVEIQVLIRCDEAFYVRDKQSGAVLQGHVPEPGGPLRTPVMHLVRLENTFTTSFSGSFPYMHHSGGNWIITDIDDLLSTKSWYQK